MCQKFIAAIADYLRFLISARQIKLGGIESVNK